MEGFSILALVGFAVLLSLLGGKLISRFQLPLVTGYVIMGIILGKSFLNVITQETVARLGIFNDLALGVIAFLIGGEFYLPRIKKLGKTIGLIALFESFFAFLLVTLVVLMITHKLYLSLVLGAVSSATAPAATVAVINQYRASGPLTTTILGVVGSDDAFALIIYSFASTLARSLLLHRSMSWGTVVLRPFREVAFSLLLGVFLGWILGNLLRRLRQRNEAFTLALGFLLLGEGLSQQWDLSELLTIMAMAMTAVNFSPPRRFNQVMESMNLAGFPIVAGFFLLAGTKLDVKLLPTIGFLGIAYTLARMAGKMGGASLGATLARAPGKIRKWVGVSLFPQIGVAIALAVVVDREFSPLGSAGVTLSHMVINILLFTTVITEIVGPILTRKALTRAGETGMIK